MIQDKDAIERLRSELSGLLKRTPASNKISTTQQAVAFKKLHEKSCKAAKGKDVQKLQAARAELAAFYGV